MAILYRVNQFLRQVRRGPDPAIDAALRALLTDEQWRLVQRLTPADRRHLLAVHAELVRDGWRDPDLLRAALLHDVGKAGNLRRVGLSHRVANVLLNAFAPSLLARMADPDDRGWRQGLYLARHHAALGAEMARTAGVSERTSWLIAHHHDGTISGDTALNVLHRIDERE